MRNGICRSWAIGLCAVLLVAGAANAAEKIWRFGSEEERDGDGGFVLTNTSRTNGEWSVEPDSLRFTNRYRDDAEENNFTEAAAIVNLSQFGFRPGKDFTVELEVAFQGMGEWNRFGVLALAPDMRGHEYGGGGFLGGQVRVGRGAVMSLALATDFGGQAGQLDAIPLELASRDSEIRLILSGAYQPDGSLLVRVSALCENETVPVWMPARMIANPPKNLHFGFGGRLRAYRGTRQPVVDLRSLKVMAGADQPSAEQRVHSIRLSGEVAGSTPAVLGYNLGHFYPGSNAEDWWRFSSVNGARSFITPGHFEVAGNEPLIDASVKDKASFLAARERLIGDPLNEEHVNWTWLRERFATHRIPGSNRFVVEDALGRITRHSPHVMVQMNVPPDIFPIDGDDDWAGKWRLWRSFFSQVYYYASEHGIQRFAMQNEPNHPHSFVEPDEWLMRAALAADAAERAVECVNRNLETTLRSKMYVPVLAGNLLNLPEGAYALYGRPILQAWDRDFLGEHTGSPLYYSYAQQAYDHAPDRYADAMRNLMGWVQRDIREGMPRPVFSITEFNVHTGRSFDAIPQTMDSPDKVVWLASLLGELMNAGVEEFYLFKFGLTRAATANAQYRTHKNGMHYVHNEGPPHEYGGPTRGADAYRLFCRAFQSGRERLMLTAESPAGVRAFAARDPRSGSVWIYSVNETAERVPLDLDVSAWVAGLQGAVWIEEVSESSGGAVVEALALEQGRVDGVEQPPQSVWLLHLPASETHASWTAIEPTARVEVQDGAGRRRNLAGRTVIRVANDVRQADGRSAGLVRFTLPELEPDRLLAAVVEFPARATVEDQPVQAQVFVSDHADWSESSVSWSTVPDLRSDVPAGAMLRHRVVQGQGETVFIAGQLIVEGTAAQPKRLDVTDLMRDRLGRGVTFLLAQEPRWDYNAAFHDLEGDVQAGGIELAGHERAGFGSAVLRLLLRE